METNIDELVVRAREGDKEAVDGLVREITGMVFGLAMRMLGRPAEAEDATQEILIKTITHLSEFRGESAFTTWVYRIAANHLLAARKSLARQQTISFDEYAEAIDQVIETDWSGSISEADYGLRLEEMLISCTQGMLLCLNRDQRLSYILGDIFDLDGNVGGYIMDVSAETFRKRLSRARDRLFTFMKKKCSLIDPDNPCTCIKQVACEITQSESGLPKPIWTGYACRVRRLPEVMNRLHELGELKRVAAVFRSHPEYLAPETLGDQIRTLLASKQYDLLDGNLH